MTPESINTGQSVRQREDNLVQRTIEGIEKRRNMSRAIASSVRAREEEHVHNTIERIENRRYMIRTLTGQENPVPTDVRTALDALRGGIESFHSQLKTTSASKR